MMGGGSDGDDGRRMPNAGSGTRVRVQMGLEYGGGVKFVNTRISSRILRS